ncbi:MAG TPA: FtsX-like permease family protein [Candidatus Didemnitutus sp.]|nr:FtsX-like permease family protein [Candidatus Didemnitutus sp.]
MIFTAYRFIRFDKAKSIGVVIGIVISIFLIGQQVGILSFLTGLMGGLVENADTAIGQIWVVDNVTQNANELTPLDERLVRQIRSITGVANTYGIVIAGATVKFDNGKTAPVLLIGSEAPIYVAGPRRDKIDQGDITSLANDGAVSAEHFDASVFNHSVDVGTPIEINGKSAMIRVQTKNARGFAGSFFYTTIARARYYADFPENKVSAVAVNVTPGSDLDSVCSAINSSIFGVRAWRSDELKNSTVSFITITSNIGVSIGSLVVFAVISGFFIIGLTLYSSALDRMRDYGTLKAIGATNGYVRRLILTQALIFAIVGYGIAIALLEGFRVGVSQAGLTISYTPVILGGLFLITLFISVGGSLFAIRKVTALEPASVFRG